MKLLSAIKKELLEIGHDKTMLIVLLVFPVFVMLFMGSSFRSMEIRGLPIGISGDNSSFSNALFSGLNQSKAFNLKSFESQDDAMTAFRNGELRAVIVVPPKFDQAIIAGNGSQVMVIVDNSDLALEQAVLAAMSSVIQASSANITKSYISNAWNDLISLNNSASSLASDISQSRKKMEATKLALIGIKTSMNDTNIDSLDDAINGASKQIESLGILLEDQKTALANNSQKSKDLFNQSEQFISNAKIALDDSIVKVGSAHEKLQNENQKLKNTVVVLDNSIVGLEMIKNNSSDNTTIAALTINIQTLKALKDTTEQQINDTENEINELEGLNTTLQNFKLQLIEYSNQIDLANGSQDIEQMAASLENVSKNLHSLQSSLDNAGAQITKLKTLMNGIKSTLFDIDGTLDSALEQTKTVDELIGSLQKTVADQTGRDPNTVASPLSVKVENQYERESFVDFIIPQVIAVCLLFSCFFLGAISLVREKTKSTIIRALMIPEALGNLIAGKIITLVLLSCLQVAMIIAVASVIFGVAMPDSLGMLVLATIISSLVLSSIGVLLGFYAKSESAAIQSCLLIAIPMLFLGNIIFSPDLLPNYTQILQQLLPLSHVTNIFKIILITNGNPAADIVALASYFFLLAFVMAYILINRREISNYI